MAKRLASRGRRPARFVRGQQRNDVAADQLVR
jgi:hypothetical protein